MKPYFLKILSISILCFGFALCTDAQGSEETLSEPPKGKGPTRTV